MKTSRQLAIMTWLSLLTALTCFADPDQKTDPDPFGELPASELQPAKGKFFAGGVTVKLVEDSNPEVVLEKDWPQIQPPTAFNQAFQKPAKIWRMDGGFIASFDAGEFGGALFFATTDAKRWTKVLDAHIQHLERYEGDTLLAVGGLAHLDNEHGRAHLLSRTNKGRWQARVVFETQVGVPSIIGTTVTDIAFKAKAERLIVIGLESTWGWKPLFGISSKGTLHYLGETPRKKRANKAQK